MDEMDEMDQKLIAAVRKPSQGADILRLVA